MLHVDGIYGKATDVVDFVSLSYFTENISINCDFCYTQIRTQAHLLVDQDFARCNVVV